MISQILNVAIVLIGLYIAFAVACSWLQEQIAALLKLRANTLAKGIKELVSRDADTFKLLSTHPMIAAASSEATQFPSYVEPRNFTLAFWQTVGTKVETTGSTVGQAVVDSKAAVSSLVSAVNDWKPVTYEAKRIKQSSSALLTAAEGDYDKLLAATDVWFNAQMDRVSGWYKRQVQYIVIAIAVLLAFGSGLDTIDVGRQLFAAPVIAQATAQSITAAVNKGGTPDAGATNVATAIADAQDLQNLRLFWWSSGSSRTSSKSSPATANVAPAVATTAGAEKIIGILITAIAIALGAPFWFDLLKGIVNVRMSGEKPVGTPPAATPNPST